VKAVFDLMVEKKSLKPEFQTLVGKIS